MQSLTEGWMGWCFVSFLGLSVGSFANVVIHRVPREGLSLWKPARSLCPTCKRQLSWLDNVPLLSWLCLRGRCRYCSTKISARYLVVELLTGALFVAFWAQEIHGEQIAWTPLLVGWVMASLCVIVSAIDLEHFIIPDVITLPGIALGLLASLLIPQLHVDGVLFLAGEVGPIGGQPFVHGSSLLVALMGMLAGGGSLWLVGRLGNIMLRSQIEAAGVQDAMGLGDVKWMAFAGTILGPILVLEAILVGCFVGALVGIFLKIAARMSGRGGPVGLPFGPFLSVGILTELAWPGAAWRAMTWLAV
ncbi:MAG: prepilin peptidase [Planctomycetota bacterium]|jgi:leader peptidase (prepilin peptidase) / N-methyltransferase|nr:prepilin peptidase [Planctomycetota bacterium]